MVFRLILIGLSAGSGGESSPFSPAGLTGDNLSSAFPGQTVSRPSPLRVGRDDRCMPADVQVVKNCSDAAVDLMHPAHLAIQRQQQAWTGFEAWPALVEA